MSGYNIAIGISSLGCAITGGVYFAFSTFVLRALEEQGQAGADGMRAINQVILQSGFMPLFFATTLACLAFLAIGWFGLATNEGKFLVAGAAIYLIGMFLCTVAVHVPLNDQLAGTSGISGWQEYLATWLPWNHVRTVCSFAASALLMCSLKS